MTPTAGLMSTEQKALVLQHGGGEISWPGKCLHSKHGMCALSLNDQEGDPKICFGTTGEMAICSHCGSYGKMNAIDEMDAISHKSAMLLLAIQIECDRHVRGEELDCPPSCDTCPYGQLEQHILSLLQSGAQF